jgi:adenine deaminase
MTAPLEVPLAVLQRRVRVARGQEPADLLLSGGRVVNVFTGRVEAADVAVADGWIAGVGPYPWQARERLDLGGGFVVPGLIDCHQHLESTLLTPAELARVLLPHGTTATLSDSHEVGNVLGTRGIDMLIRASEGLPFDLFFAASSCVPAARWEHAGAVLGPKAVAELLGRPRVLGLAEMMDVPAVLCGDAEALEKVRAALATGRAVDGHAPALVGRELVAYAAAGMRSDHESATVEEARAKAALGMLVQVREGSIARNLDALLPLLAAGELGDDWAPVTDDVLPPDLKAHGHIDGLLRRLVGGGVEAAQAVRHATLVPARHYGLADRGAVAPGYRADLVVLDDLKDFAVRLTLKDGRVVARDGAFVGELTVAPLPEENTVHLPPLDESRFRLRPAGDESSAVGLRPGQLVTGHERRPVTRDADGCWRFDPGQDVALLASVERHKALGSVGLGLVAGLGLRRGALASSVAHDSHNLVVAATNERDALAAVRALEESGGGFVAVADGAVLARLPLPFAGLLSRQPADAVCAGLEEAEAAARALGCGVPCPFGVLSFLALPVIPDLKITDQGLWDVVKQRFVRP